MSSIRRTPDKYGHVISRLPSSQTSMSSPVHKRVVVAPQDVVATPRASQRRVPQTIEEQNDINARVKYVSYQSIYDMYDWCSVNDFDLYHRIFYTWYWLASLISIVLSTTSGALNGPNLFQGEKTNSNTRDTLALLALITGVLSAMVASITHIVDVKFVADECKYARGELAFYLTEQIPMPRHVFDRIAKIGLLCFPHPRKCRVK